MRMKIWRFAQVQSFCTNFAIDWNDIQSVIDEPIRLEDVNEMDDVNGLEDINERTFYNTKEHLP